MPSRSLVLPTVPAKLRSDPRDASTAFFFRQCALPGRHGWPLGHKYFEHLLPLYNSAPPESDLAIAVSAMALSVATAQHAAQHVDEQLHPLDTQAELTASLPSERSRQLCQIHGEACTTRRSWLSCAWTIPNNLSLKILHDKIAVLN